MPTTTKKPAAKKVTKKAPSSAKRPAVMKTAVPKKPAKKSAAKAVATKKVPKKPAAKRATASTGRSKTSGKKQLSRASNSESFWVTSGVILNDLISLRDALATMDTAVYKYHVAKNRHDFADWVKTVLEDDECAKALRKAKSPKTAHTVVVRQLKLYKV